MGSSESLRSNSVVQGRGVFVCVNDQGRRISIPITFLKQFTAWKITSPKKIRYPGKMLVFSPCSP